MQHYCKGCGVLFEGRSGQQYHSYPCSVKHRPRPGKYQKTGRRRKCEGCGCMYVAERHARRFCGRKCFGQWRKNRPEFKASCSRGGRGRVLPSGTVQARLERLVGGRTDALYQAYRIGRREAYSVDALRNYRRGYSDGFSAAIGENPRERRGRAA